MVSSLDTAATEEELELLAAEFEVLRAQLLDLVRRLRELS